MSDSRSALKVEMVLFDLDGTLLDTARDLSCALARLCEEESREPPGFEDFRRVVSQGSRAMLALGFDSEPEDADFDRLRERLLELYREDLATHTRPFDGAQDVIDLFESRLQPWGIVTNKPGWLTEPLLDALAFAKGAHCVISGDTLPRRKPDPDQLLLACEMTGTQPERCAYVGDARSDIVAGTLAGMTTIAASFGYIPAQEDPTDWQADMVIGSLAELMSWLTDV